MSERWWAELTWLDAEQVARIWTEAREGHAEVKKSTVVSYVKESKPKVGGKPGRFAKFPIPAPVPGRALIWVPAVGQTMDDLVDELRSWWTERPRQTRGAGGRFEQIAEDSTDPELLHRPGEQ